MARAAQLSSGDSQELQGTEAECSKKEGTLLSHSLSPYSNHEQESETLNTVSTALAYSKGNVLPEFSFLL